MNLEERKLNNKAFELLEYNKIKETLKEYALSKMAKDRIDKLVPMMDKSIIETAIRETTEARAIADISGAIPIYSLKDVEDIKAKIKRGSVLLPEDLDSIGMLLRESNRLRNFMSTKSTVAPMISSYALSIYELEELRNEIDRCILRGRVDDRASAKLGKIRKRIFILENRIKIKLDSMLMDERYKGYLQDSLISQRQGRYVIPIKSEHKRHVEGDIHDKSQSGSTVFIEPVEIKKLQNELDQYKIEEEREVYRILSTLTVMVCEYEKEIGVNIEVMSNYDFIFAKGKLSKSMDGTWVELNNRNYINIKKGKHPLIGKKAVPLDFEMGQDYRAVVITGPNTGGKTVALKTVGLLTMMAQSGLHVPVEKGSSIAIFADILVDIGDGQSIEQSLSTFSSHITNIINILNCADKYTLVILDELGAGTDPGEGMGLAISILEKLYDKGASICATTHYSEIKDFAQNSQGFINGSMEFDINTLKPLYKLNIGKPGESNAFLIALRLGMDKALIERAHVITYKEDKRYEDYKLQPTENNSAKPNDEKHKEAVKVLLKAKDTAVEKERKAEREAAAFKVGDCVFISFMKRTGVICELENSKGEYGVMVMRKKLKINKARLSIYIAKDELYPENYDYDIVFKSKEDRKSNKLMNKKHQEGMAIVVKEGEV